jgi:cell wall assembly regulator SMI1
MTDPRVVDADLLGELEARVRDRTGNALRLRATRASDEQLGQAERALGWSLPDEARTWWSWWNPATQVEIIPVVELVSLETAVALYAVRRDLGRSAAEEAQRVGVAELADPELWWNRKWLPLLGPFQHDTVAIDCGVPASAPTPVLRITAMSVGDEGYDAPVAPSLGKLVQHWIERFDAGDYVYDRGRAEWQYYPAGKSLRVDSSP